MWQPEKPVEMDVDGEAVEEYDEGRDLRKKLDEITAALGEAGDQEAAIVGYRGVLDYVCTDAAGPSESVGKVKEEAIYGLAKAYADSKRYVGYVWFGLVVRVIFAAATAAAAGHFWMCFFLCWLFFDLCRSLGGPADTTYSSTAEELHCSRSTAIWAYNQEQNSSRTNYWRRDGADAGFLDGV